MHLQSCANSISMILSLDMFVSCCFRGLMHWLADTVRVRPGVSPSTGWGSATYASVGLVRVVRPDGKVLIDFPEQSGWVGAPRDMVVVRPAGGGAGDGDRDAVPAVSESGPQVPVPSAEFDLDASSSARGKPVTNLVSGRTGSFWESDQSGRATHRISVRFRGGAAANRLELGVAGNPSTDGSYSPAVLRVTGKLHGGGDFESSVRIPSTPSTDVVQWVVLRDGRVPFFECVVLSETSERQGCNIRLYGLRASRSAADVTEGGAALTSVSGRPDAAAVTPGTGVPRGPTSSMSGTWRFCCSRL
jgi:hypothetical protein